MPSRRLLQSILIVSLTLAAAFPAMGYVAWENHVLFAQTVTKDVVKLLPRAMGSFIYQNEYDFMRGITFMRRNVMTNPGKQLDMEEVREQAFARLSRDIPYCVEALKGGEIKLDTSAGNVAGRLGMIAYSILVNKAPAFPDLEYLRKFSRAFDSAIGESVIDVWVYYDGYGDFHSLGELLERLRQEGMPTLRHVRNDKYPLRMREDPFAMFRAPSKFNKKLVLTDVDVNDIYSRAINCIIDTYVYIWKCSGMDLAHPSYAPPPGTIVSRPSRRRTVQGGVLTRTMPAAKEEGGAGAAAPPEGERPPGFEEGASPELAPAGDQGGQGRTGS